MKGVTKELEHTLKVFNIHPMKVMDRLMSVYKNTYVLDVLQLDKLLHEQGYSEKEHGSLADYINLKAGKGASDIIKKFF